MKSLPFFTCLIILGFGKALAESSRTQDSLKLLPGSNLRLLHESDENPSSSSVGADSEDPAFQEGAEEGEEGEEGEEDEAEHERIERIHSILSIASWGALADISLIFIRLMKGRKITFKTVVIPAQALHSLVMWIVIILSGVSTGLILNIHSDELAQEFPEESDKGFHYICGLTILFLMLTAIFTGPITLMTLKSNKIINKIIGIKWIHRGAGALLYLLAKANVITGVLFYDDGEWEVGVYIYLGILFAVHILIQLMFWYQDKYSNHSPMRVSKAIPTSPEAVSLLEAINKGIPREEVIKNFPKMQWIMLGNGVYNLTDWIHPGGNFLIDSCVGREVGRYFYGNHPLEGTTIKPHKHSALTVSQLNTFYIGELSSSYESILTNKKGDEGLVSQKSDSWRISKITPISESVSEICFQNPNLQIKSFGKSLFWLGRHFRVSFNTLDSVARPYSIALSLTQENHKLRQDIYKYFDEIMATESGSASFPNFTYNQNYSNSQDSLSFFIKNYSDFKGLSNQIHQTKVSGSANTFRIEGPFGRGLELSTSSSGTHCIICAGTGILPMIDFLNLFLWKTMYQLIKEKAGNEKAEQINILKIPFDSYFSGLKVKLIGAFANSKEVLGLDIIKKLAEINKKYKTNNFEAMMKGYSDENIPATNEDFSSIDFLLKVLSRKEDKYYVIGPPSFNEKVPQALRKLSIPNGKIMLV